MTRQEAVEQLVRAAGAGDLQEMQAALADGADIDACSVHGTRKGFNAVEAAVCDNRVQALHWLVARGASLDLMPLTGRSLSLLASQPLVNQAMLQTLVNFGLDPDWRDVSGQTLLHLVAGGFVERVRVLLGAGADPNARGAWERTPLHEAVWMNRDACCAVLIAAGADTEARERHGNRPLDIAATSDLKLHDAAAALIAMGASTEGLEIVDDRVREMVALHPLECAVITGNVDVVALSLARHGQVEAELVSRVLDRAQSTPQLQTLLRSWAAAQEARRALNDSVIHPHTP